MLITITSAGPVVVTFVPFEDVRLPDYGVRKIDLLETVEQERVLIDKGGNRIGLSFAVSGVLKQSALTDLENLTTAAIGTYAESTVEITSGAATIWDGEGYIVRVGDVTLISGKVLFADAALGFVAGDTLCRATIEFMFKE